MNRLAMLARVLIGLLVLGSLAGACTAQGAVNLAAGNRTIYIAAIEPKGSANVEKESFPSEALPAGGGYALDAPDDTGTWTVETYRWLPSEITVVEGDQVTLEVLGVNGAAHPTTLEGYDLSFDVKRGQITRVEFTADKAGIFRFVCSAHAPAMTGSLVVLPAG